VTDTQVMTLEFAAAMDDVLKEIAEEIQDWYDDEQFPAAFEAVPKVERAVAVLREAKYSPCEASIALLDRYRRSRN
jgi:hypothetical protein